MKQKFDVTGMTCSACSAHVEKSVRKLDGIQVANVNLLANSMYVEYDDTKLDDAAIIHAVVDAGYNAFVHNKSNDKKGAAQVEASNMELEIKNMKQRIIISFLFMIPLMYISMGHMVGLPLPAIFHGNENAMIFAFTQFLLSLPVVYVNRKYYQVGYKTLFKGSPNMDTLIAIGSSAAMIYGIFAIYRIGYGLGHGDMAAVEQYSMDLYFESAVMILTLITLGKYLEARSKGKTSEAINKLMDLAPKTATVLKDGKEVTVPVEDIMIGDIVVVKPGQSIPVDGVIIEGSSSVDESALTGESIPVEKNINDKVIAASINKSGAFQFRATKVGDDTTLAQIIQLVEDANASKAPIAKLADKVAGVFVPVVMIIALAAAVIWLLTGHTFEFSLSVGIAVLVISCPCALGLATPVAIMVGTGKGAENGILIKSAEALETAHTVQTVILDKTGTITEGKPKVTDILTFHGYQEEELLQIAASAERKSEHPLAEAIIEKAKEKELPFLETSHFDSITGKGIIAMIENKAVLAGNLKLMQDYAIEDEALIETANRFADEGKTPLYFAVDGKIAGIIAVADTVKPTSKQAVKELTDMGIEVIMLTGDNKKTAEAIQKQVGIPKVIAEVMPQDKESEVRKEQEKGKKVAMVGDGINDAPALAKADVGIAIGAGTDVAIESADIVLMKSDLLDAVTAIDLSKAVIKNIKENLFWAFFYNTIGIPIAAGVLYPFFGIKLSPMLGAAAMSLSSVCVVSNALRLKWFKPHRSSLPAVSEDNHKMQLDKNEDEKGENGMKKEMKIEGMSCSHCSARVEKALNALDGVSASVDLEGKTAHITLDGNVSDEDLTKAVVDAGYEVVSIQ